MLEFQLLSILLNMHWYSLLCYRILSLLSTTLVLIIERLLDKIFLPCWLRFCCNWCSKAIESFLRKMENNVDLTHYKSVLFANSLFFILWWDHTALYLSCSCTSYRPCNLFCTSKIPILFFPYFSIFVDLISIVSIVLAKKKIFSWFYFIDSPSSSL